jgi:hypothetical protein
MAVTVPTLIPVTGSQEAAQVVVDALGDMKRYATGQIDAIKAAHNQQLAAVRRQGEAKLAAAQTAHQAAIAELTAQTAAEIADLKRQLAEVRKAVMDQSALRQRLNVCAFASQLLASALKPD